MKDSSRSCEMSQSIVEEDDDATATLIIDLQIADINEALSAKKGKGRADQVFDDDVALQICLQELQDQRISLADRSMSRSLTRAVLHDARLLRTLAAQEDTAAHDRNLAHRLAGVAPLPLAIEGPKADEADDDELISRLTALYVSDRAAMIESLDEDEVAGQEGAESSAWAGSRRRNPNGPRRQCISCDVRRSVIDVYQAPCDHGYCRDCLHTLFELSTTDETLFPPRCCRQEMPLSSVRSYLSTELVDTFEEKAIEYRTPNRTYCSQPTCSAFIPLGNIENENAACSVCAFITCTICKSPAHEGDCPEDTTTQQVLDLAQEEGWQRCYNCRRLVELNLGCNHMT